LRNETRFAGWDLKQQGIHSVPWQEQPSLLMWLALVSQIPLAELPGFSARFSVKPQ
jgi:hypothetical protein